MSSYNFSRPTKPNYFVNFLVKGYIFPAILIAAVLSTALSVAYQFNFLAQISSENAKIFSVAVVAFFITLLTIYVCVSIKKPEIGMNDAVSIGYFFSGLIYFIFLLVLGRGFKYVTLFNIILSVSLVILGAVLTLFSSIYFNYEFDNDTEIDSKKSYLKETSKKYSFIGILLCSIVINFIFFVLLKIKYGFINNLVKKGAYDAPDYFFTYFKDILLENKVLIGFVGVGILLLFLYAIFALNEKKINPLDIFVWGYIFNIPLLIALVYLLGDNESMINYLVIGVLSVVVIAFAIVRNIFFKKDNIEQEDENFFKKFFTCKNIFLSFGLTAILVTFINVANASKILDVFTQGDRLRVYLGLVPFAVIYIASLIGFLYIALGLLKSVVIFNKPLYDKNDNMILYNVAFGFFELIAFLFVEQSMNFVNIVILASYIIISFDIALLRRAEIK